MIVAQFLRSLLSGAQIIWQMYETVNVMNYYGTLRQTQFLPHD